MTTKEEYLAAAAEAKMKAELAKDEDEKKSWLQIAFGYLALASRRPDD